MLGKHSLATDTIHDKKHGGQVRAKGREGSTALPALCMLSVVVTPQASSIGAHTLAVKLVFTMKLPRNSLGR